MAHSYMKKWPFSLSVNPNSDAEEDNFEAAEEDEALVNEAGDIPDVQDNAGNGLPEYSEREMTAQGE